MVPSGFSVHASQRVEPDEPKKIEQLAFYLTRPPLATKNVELTHDGLVTVRTPLDPRTGKREKVMDPLDWIHTIVTQLPEPKQHLVRWYGK